MTKETCETCANGECEAIRCLFTWDTHVPCFRCANYEECTDSLEQMALDALTFATCLMNTGCELDGGFADYEAEYAGEQTRFTDIETSLRLRLRALGVEVDDD